MSTHNMFSLRNKKNIMWIPPLICSYAFEDSARGYGLKPGLDP